MNKTTILIPTKDKLEDLKVTLDSLSDIILSNKVDCIICDDGSNSNNSIEFVNKNYPMILVLKNKKSKGIHFTRNLMFSKVKTPYALCLDDDVSLITKDVLALIEFYFENNTRCGIIAFRIYWNKIYPKITLCDEKNTPVKSFGAGACACRMSYLNKIPKFLDWFVFYGEEDFAAMHLFKKGWEVHYVPEILVQHRVDIKTRKKDKDYKLRLRRSLRSGWYLYLLFYPLKLIPKRFIYTFWMQIKLKVFKGDGQALLAIIQAMWDVVFNLPRLIKNANRFTNAEFLHYQQLPEAKLYWKPSNNDNNSNKNYGQN